MIGSWLLLLVQLVSGQNFKLEALQLLTDTFQYLSLSAPRSFNLLDSDNVSFSLDSQLAYRCVKLRFSHITNSLGQKFDTGSDACGVVMTEFRGQCLNDKLHNIQIVTNSLIFPEKVKVSPSIRMDSPNQSFKIPITTYIKRVTMVWRYNSIGRYLTAIRFMLGDGSQGNITCSTTYQSVESMTFTNMERINGFYVSYDGNQISDIDFFFHRLVSDYSKKSVEESRTSVRERQRQITNRVEAADTDYALVTQSNYVYSNEVDDTFEIRGPFGEKIGNRFSDSYLYGHWTVASINVWTNATHILGMQLSMKNLFISYTIVLQPQGNNTGKLQTLTVPAGKTISLIETFITTDFRPCAIRFSLNTGAQLGVVGNSACISSARANNVLVGDRESFVGLNGYADATSIRSIGYIMIIQNGDDIMSL